MADRSSEHTEGAPEQIVAVGAVPAADPLSCVNDPRARSVLAYGRAAGNAAVVARLGRPAAGPPHEIPTTRGTDALQASLARVATLRHDHGAAQLLRNGDSAGGLPDAKPADGGSTPTTGPTPTGSSGKVDEDAKKLNDAITAGNVADVITIMSGRDPMSRGALSAAWDRLNTGEKLPGRIKSTLVEDGLVKAFSLLTAETPFDKHVSLGLALIPVQTRDEALFRIVEGEQLPTRQALETRYDAAFGSTAPEGGIGKGSLKKDVDSDLSGWAKEKVRAMFLRDLTNADHVYFGSLARSVTTDEDGVLKVLQDTWAQGPAAFAELVANWKAGPQSKGHGDGAWTALSLREAMRKELSGRYWEYAEGILDAYEGLEKRALELAGQQPGATATPADPKALFAKLDVEELEEAQLKTAWSRVHTASGDSSGLNPFYGWGTDDADLKAGLETIRTIWRTRLDRATNDPKWKPKLEEYKQGWAKAVADGKGQIEQELSGAEARQATASLSAELKEADRFYYAGKGNDHDGAWAILFEAWGKGRLSEFETDASKERKFADTGEVRPAFYPELIGGNVNTGETGPKIRALTKNGSDQVRGSVLLGLAFKKGGQDGLKEALAVLKSGPAGSRPDIVFQYVAHNKIGDDKDPPGRRLAGWVLKEFPGATLAIDLQDLVDPISDIKDPKEAAQAYQDRATARVGASESGVFNSFIRDWLRAYDDYTGEDTLRQAEEAKDKVDFYAKAVKAGKPDSVALVATETKKNLQQLAEAYSDLTARLGEVNAKLSAVTEALATAVELAAAAVATALTGGGAAGLFVAALSGAVAGILFRESVLGANYDTFSDENAKKLAVALAGAAFGAYAEALFKGATVTVEALRKMPRMQAFVKEATVQAFQDLGQGITNAALSKQLPTSTDIATAAVSLMANAAGSGASGAIKHGIGDATPMAEAMRISFLAHVANNTITSTAEAATEAATAGDMTGVDYMTLVGTKAFKVVGASAISTAGEIPALRKQFKERAATGLDDPAKSGATPDDEAAAKKTPEADQKAATPDDPAKGKVVPPAPKRQQLGSVGGREGVVDYDLGPLEAHGTYTKGRTANPDAEIAMYYDRSRDTWLVVQGSEDQVTSEWRKDPTHANGKWELHKHYQPGKSDEARFPSSRDLHALHAQAEANGTADQPVESVLEYRNANGEIRYTYFGRRPGEGWYVRYQDPKSGEIQKPTFFGGKEPWEPGSDFKAFLAKHGMQDADAKPGDDPHDIAKPKKTATGGEPEDDGPVPRGVTILSKVRELDYTEATLKRHPDLAKRMKELTDEGARLQEKTKERRGDFNAAAARLRDDIDTTRMNDRIDLARGALLSLGNEEHYLPLRALAADAEAMRRIAEKSDLINMVKGQLFEELSARSARTALATPEMQNALAAGREGLKFEFVGGHEVREKRPFTLVIRGQSRPAVRFLEFSDGLVVVKTSETSWMLSAIAESKSGHFSAGSLASKHSRGADLDENIKLAVEEWKAVVPPDQRNTDSTHWKDIHRAHRDEIDAIVATYSEGGQVQLDFERLANLKFVRVDSDGKKVDVTLTVDPKGLTVSGFVPKDVDAADLKASGQKGGNKFEVHSSQYTAKEIQDAGQAIIDAWSKKP